MKKTESENEKKKSLTRKQKTGAIVAAIVVSVLMLLYLATFVYAVKQSRSVLFPMLIVFIVIICAIIGIVVALIQRVKEIDGGEEYDARNY